MVHYNCMECRGEGLLWSRLLQEDVPCDCTEDSGDEEYERWRDSQL